MNDDTNYSGITQHCVMSFRQVGRHTNVFIIHEETKQQFLLCKLRSHMTAANLPRLEELGMHILRELAEISKDE